MTDTATATAEKAATFEEASDRTLHWTLSLYIDAERLYGPGKPLGARHDPDAIRRVQLADPVSRALRDAIEPLFNDIADREWLGNVQDFLLAARPAGNGGSAAATAREHDDLIIKLPASIRWETEGVGFVASPRGLDAERTIRLRRFWFAHNDGALSYHLAFTTRYDHTPTDYFYLSLLQKLCAPKEFSLSERWQAAANRPDPIRCDDLGVAPLDRITVTDPDGRTQRFWACVRDYFRADAKALLARLAAQYGVDAPVADPLDLIEMAPLLEVPGLLMPKCRTLFFFHDERFFNRVMPPAKPDGDGRYPRRMMVRKDCYAPYGQKMTEMIKAAGGGDVLLSDGDENSYWHWVRERPDDLFYSNATDEDVAALHGGTFDDDGETLHIPAFDRKRVDCLDYLFLSGFNQNIIDFMNQDTSEILDSLDPIFPKNEEQQEEGFFVRYANHRSMITYAQYSRSLDVGNDYIGTCPYAFLIHVLSMHNEFLARGYEWRTAKGIEAVERDMAKTDRSLEDYRRIEQRINDLKIARYRDFERHRHVNVFRYDTERDVFEELERLRGTERKQQALSLALASLEDHATDLDARQQAKESRRSAARERNLNLIFAVVGLLAASQFLSDLSGYLKTIKDSPPPLLKAPWLDWLATPGLAEIIQVLSKCLGVVVTGSALLLGLFLLVRFIWSVLRPKTDKAIGADGTRP
ncbi:MAG: hypothetical protein KF842_03780 [Caulobacter sp.]|nr:hypothetical protein [Caulobacter sp.]